MAESSNNSRTPTHTAYAFKREGKKFGRWLEIGTARQLIRNPARLAFI